MTKKEMKAKLLEFKSVLRNLNAIKVDEDKIFASMENAIAIEKKKIEEYFKSQGTNEDIYFRKIENNLKLIPLIDGKISEVDPNYKLNLLFVDSFNELFAFITGFYIGAFEITVPKYKSTLKEKNDFIQLQNKIRKITFGMYLDSLFGEYSGQLLVEMMRIERDILKKRKLKYGERFNILLQANEIVKVYPNNKLRDPDSGVRTINSNNILDYYKQKSVQEKLRKVVKQ